ncbi:MAG: hypothetical protein ABL930_11375 [Pseudobdellovibrio sp.]
MRVYQNLEMALYDITSAQLQFMSHKNFVGIVKNGCSFLETLNKNWLKQSYNIQAKDHRQQWLEYIETLNADTNLVVWSSENEITGEVLVSDELCAEIHEKLSKKRIFSIQITHRLEKEKIEKLPAYAIIVLRNSIFADGPVVVLSTDKYKAPSLIGEYQNFESNSKIDTYLQSAQKIQNISSDNFENSYFSKFSGVCLRLNDRVVLLFEDINAAAIKEDLNLSDEECFCTAQMPFWVLDLFKLWWPEAENENLLRGLMVVAYAAADKDTLIIQKIAKSAQKIRRLGQIDVI